VPSPDEYAELKGRVMKPLPVVESGDKPQGWEYTTVFPLKDGRLVMDSVFARAVVAKEPYDGMLDNTIRRAGTRAHPCL
jgi:hypothetical protein